ncbi:MAG: radical SAM protein [Candidatus Omnitrophica bacterium]|nr:radical SAM protein [Candidatus Omnitrophota bacterium]
MRVVLITCPSYGVLHPPLSLALLSASLKNQGHEVVTLDLSIKLFNELPEEKREIYWDLDRAALWHDKGFAESMVGEERINEWVELLVGLKPDILGFSVYSTNLQVSLLLAQKLKIKNDRIKVIFGGPFCRRDNGVADSIINYSYVDIVVSGEGEITLQEIVASYEKYGKVEFCNGALIKLNNQAVYCGHRQPLDNLDSLPFADFSDFDFSMYKERLVPILTSRGCLYNCAFCNEKSFWQVYRNRSAVNIFQEIKQIISKYAINTIRFNDLLLNGNLIELEKLCDMLIQDNTKIQWGGYITVRKMNKSLIMKMRASGCYFIFAGIESGSQNILNKFKKGVRLEEGEELLRLFAEAGISTHTGWIVGFPDESFSDFKQTIDFIRRNNRYIDRVAPASLLTIPPGSPICDHPDMFGVKRVIHAGDYTDNTTNLKLRQTRLEYFNKYIAYTAKEN